jgi:acetyl-CoA acetyltransferase family protein
MGCGFESHRAYMGDAYVYAGVRTPFGRYAGALAGSRPDDLAATVVWEVVQRAPGLDPSDVDDVILGCANGAGEDNRNVGRMAVLLAGLPVSVPGVTVNRLCGSSLQAAMDASRLVETGDASVVVAGGVESMTRAPWVLPKPSRPFPAGHETLVSTTLGWRLVNPRMPEEFTAALGECNEQLAEALGIGRDRQDAFALASHQRAAQAWADGFYDDLVLPVDGLVREEGVRPDADLETLAGLKPAFRPDGTITAGNASPLNDGASALLVAAEGAALGLEPLIAPVQAAERALSGAGIGWADVGAVELNEAFAVQSLACLDAWKIDPEIVNTRGGAIAIGHPLGASGARVLSTLTKVLVERRERWGVATICIGVGQGLAVVLENVA